MNDERMAVRCRDVAKDFGVGDVRVRALRGVNLDIPLGRLTMLVGPSGCGKTTLLCVISGLLDSTHGAVEVLGQSLASLSARERVLFRLENVQYCVTRALTAPTGISSSLIA